MAIKKEVLKPSEPLLTEEQIKELELVLREAEKNGRIQITQWRNFIDYDLQPFIKKRFIDKAEYDKLND